MTHGAKSLGLALAKFSISSVEAEKPENGLFSRKKFPNAKNTRTFRDREKFISRPLALTDAKGCLMARALINIDKEPVVEMMWWLDL